MPTWNFVHIHGVGKTRAVDSPLSPPGMPHITRSVLDHLRRLYDALKGRDPQLSRQGFEDFLRDFQRDGKKPSWVFSASEKRTAFSFDDFVYFWKTEHSAAKKPTHPEDKDLDKPISNYFISSSHNTYIEDGNQFSGPADELQYKKVSCLRCRFPWITADPTLGTRKRLQMRGNRCMERRGSRWRHPWPHGTGLRRTHEASGKGTLVICTHAFMDEGEVPRPTGGDSPRRAGLQPTRSALRASIPTESAGIIQGRRCEFGQGTTSLARSQDSPWRLLLAELHTLQDSV